MGNHFIVLFFYSREGVGYVVLLDRFTLCQIFTKYGENGYLQDVYVSKMSMSDHDLSLYLSIHVLCSPLPALFFSQ